MIQAGSLRHIIDIQKPVDVQDSAGQMDIAFETVYQDIRAAVVPLSGREYVAARQTIADVSTRITIRFLPKIAETWRVVHRVEGENDGHGEPYSDIELFDILAVLPDPKSGRDYLTLMCAKRTAEGFRRGE